MPETIFRLVLVGDSNVGKSSILVRFTDDIFSENITSTIGVDFKFKIFDVEGKKVKLTIWDTAGQERFRTLTAGYYRGAHGVICVYDVTQKTSFDNLPKWLKEIEQYASFEECVKVCVANKVDLVDDRVVTEQEGRDFARNSMMLYIETSAKTKKGIEQTFLEVAHKILQTPSLLPKHLLDEMNSGNQINSKKKNKSEEKEEEEEESEENVLDYEKNIVNLNELPTVSGEDDEEDPNALRCCF